jgi:iron(III) transport system ATP-binding protein
MTSIRLEHISKVFGQAAAIADVDLDIQAGELFFLLGPSGCGKSTLLRMVAGLLPPSAGRIFFGNRDVTGLPTEQRNAVMCFQSYALWPHMSVAANVRFGLEVRGVDRAKQRTRVAEMLKLVQMDAYAARKPNELSGGQQQRVALARALAVQPDCLLLDEPLSNLDAKLRQEMRGEIRRICKQSHVTTLYVTHDQKEALSIADRIALLKDGKVMQIGTPADLYHRPRSSFVADFIGQTNLLSGTVAQTTASAAQIQTAVGMLMVANSGSVQPQQVVKLSIRPEQVRIVNSAAPAGPNRLAAKNLESTFLGESSEHLVAVNSTRLRVIHTPPLFDPPADLAIEIDPQDVMLLYE